MKRERSEVRRPTTAEEFKEAREANDLINRYWRQPNVKPKLNDIARPEAREKDNEPGCLEKLRMYASGLTNTRSEK